jgi:peptide/nickel transport system substrate-binding protein
VRDAYNVPVVELQTQLGLSTKVHSLAFDASSRIQLHDTWIG